MYTNDVFISYAHIDNLPLSQEQQGWITRFHETLAVFLSQRLGCKARIWRDQKLQGNDVFGAEIVAQFRHAALFVSILSPRYVRSEWCRRELQDFCQSAQATGHLVIDNKTRVLKVVKTPVEKLDGFPAVISASLGYDFFLSEGQGPMDLDPYFGERFKQDYLRKICIFANDAAQLIRRLEEESSRVVGIPPPVRRTIVFLAACGFDQRDHQEWIAADLRGHGYRVLPEDRLPVEDENTHRDALLPLLRQAHLSIHLIGASGGVVPDGPSHQSLMEMHNTLAAARSRAEPFKRLIWMPEGLEPTHPEQRRFLHSLASDAHQQAGADLLRGSVEDFRTAMHATLDALERPTPQPSDPGLAATAPTPDRRLIYLLCVREDRTATVPLRKWLKSRGWVASLPAFDGDAAVVRQVHEELVRDCRAVWIFYGAGDEAWQRTVTIELRRARAYREGRPLPPPLLYLAPPSSDDKSDLVDVDEPHLIDGRSGFSPEPLLPVLERILSLPTPP